VSNHFLDTESKRNAWTYKSRKHLLIQTYNCVTAIYTLAHSNVQLYNCHLHTCSFKRTIVQTCPCSYMHIFAHANWCELQQFFQVHSMTYLKPASLIMPQKLSLGFMRACRSSLSTPREIFCRRLKTTRPEDVHVFCSISLEEFLQQTKGIFRCFIGREIMMRRVHYTFSRTELWRIVCCRCFLCFW